MPGTGRPEEDRLVCSPTETFRGGWLCGGDSGGHLNCWMVAPSARTQQLGCPQVEEVHSGPGEEEEGPVVGVGEVEVGLVVEGSSLIVTVVLSQKHKL